MSLTKSQIYGFGSYFRNDKHYQDIDLLIVYTQLDELELIKNLSKELINSYPIHLTIMSQEEEKEVNFIYRYYCKSLKSCLLNLDNNIYST
jgi:predicted nucleotidyltransferase